MRYEREVLGQMLTARTERLGGDMLVEITGGCAPHIGSVSTAYYDGGELRTETLLLPGHRDDVVGDRFAGRLARELGCAVTAVCGIHYESPGRQGIEEIVGRAMELLEEIVSAEKKS